jgi:integrase
MGDLLGNAYNTMESKLRSVGHFLSAHDDLNWADRVRTGKFLTPGETAEAQKLMGLAIHLHDPDQSIKQMRVKPHIKAARVGFLRQYLCWHADRQIEAIQGSAYVRVNQRYEAWLKRWKRMEDQEIASKQPRTSNVGLTQAQRELFLTVIKPGHPKNPFSPKMQGRNYAIFMLLYEHGLRMSDVLSLYVEDVHFDTKSFWLAERKNDPNETRKRIGGAKRQGRTARQRLFSQVSMNALQQWLYEDRMDEKTFPGAAASPFALVSDRWNPKYQCVNPLSGRRLSYLFEILRTKFPAVREGHRLVKVGFDPDFSPHDLRHDWCVRYVLSHHKDWTPHDDWTMRYEMGWTASSKMPLFYARVAWRELGGKAVEKISAGRTYEALKQMEEMPF